MFHSSTFGQELRRTELRGLGSRGYDPLGLGNNVLRDWFGLGECLLPGFLLSITNFDAVLLLSQPQKKSFERNSSTRVGSHIDLLLS